jgi:tetratricopeptide (TPR) repeat protein
LFYSITHRYHSLDAGKYVQALECYDEALALNVPEQEGLLLLMRSSAFLQRARSHQDQLQSIVQELYGQVPALERMQSWYVEAQPHPSLAQAVFRHIYTDTLAQEQQFKQIQYHHGLYQYSLLRSAQDALKATECLPSYAVAWLTAGDRLSELWKLPESTQYYERAMELDSALQASLKPVIERLRTRQDLLRHARAYGWSEDTLRLALDVAG